MRRACLTVLLLASLVVGACTSRQRIGVGEASRPEPATIDIQHPKYFVDVYEVDQWGRRHVIFSHYTEPPATRALEARNGDGSRNVLESVNYEVDRNSRVYIVFDRDWILEHQSSFDADVMIEGQLVGDAGSHRIEIPGYSVVGEASTSASARVRSTQNLFGMLRQVLDEWSYLERVFALDSSAGDSSLRQSRQALMARRAVLEVLLDQLTDTSASVAIGVMAANIRRNPQVLIQYARDITEQWLPLLERIGDPGNTAASRDSVGIAVRSIRFNLDRLSDIAYYDFGMGFGAGRAPVRRNGQVADTTQILANIAKDFVGFLKDADILVSQTGANPGQALVIRITNRIGTDLGRTLTLRLGVREFGLVRRVSDSFLFVNRYRVSPAANAQAVAEARDSAQTSAAPTEAETPREVRFVPAPGVTLGWTIYTRRGGLVTDILRWLEPGFGVNVSFPRFGSVVTSFTPTDTTATSPPVVSIRESSERLDVAAGVILTLFDNALQVSYGWNFTASNKREYYGLGFSFVGVYQRVNEAVAGR